ncbi:amino acid ABC transporter permease [Arthrobacter mangrovi]|uniref:Amino acid ABC transporter permease n=1 Tax=Arthrobacter mangrovi TaxID=2966350 RepID=A0ABQ5MYS4_9MICC|nr:amino acid ABC transporter permease [Arthrobacter mangrovi]GLB69147.1 amino acid ABC transporter permease [Arthrobacter mangrovi]
MTVASAPTVTARDEALDMSIKAVPVRHYGQWLTAVVVTVLLGAFVMALAQNENLDYSIVAANLFAGPILRGLVVTFQLTAVAMIGGVLIGVLLAVSKLSSNKVLSAIATGYVWFFRGVPLLVLILIFGNFSLLFDTLGIGIPFTDIMFVEVETNAVMTTFVAAAAALAIHEGAYMAEIVRGGILGVDHGQKEAAAALGMRPGLAMFRIVLPQALRMIIPPTGNQLILLLKSSSLVSVIAGGELMTAVHDIAAVNYRTIEMFFVASFWYLIIVSVLSIGQRFVERRAGRGYNR